MRTYVYWIRREAHTDIASEGYVGITKDLLERIRQHKKKASNLHLENALNKYDDIIVECYAICPDRETAKNIEKSLRPSPKIGWNEAPGGDIPPPVKGNKKVIEKIRNSILALGTVPYCENTHSPEAIEKRLEARRKSKPMWFHNPDTLEYRLIKTAYEDVPEGWVRGRKPKVVREPKERTGNSAKWIVNDGEVDHQVFNLKQWCRDNNIPYLGEKPYNSWKNYKATKVKK